MLGREVMRDGGEQHVRGTTDTVESLAARRHGHGVEGSVIRVRRRFTEMGESERVGRFGRRAARGAAKRVGRSCTGTIP